MKACVLHEIGVIRCETLPRPEPGAGEALIRVGACGVCGSDLPRIFEKGAHVMPLVPGHEFSGVVEAVGSDADAALVNTRVTVFPLIPCCRCACCEIGAYAQCADYGYLGSRRDGAFAEYVVAPTANCLPLPDAVSLEAGAMTEPAAVAAHAIRMAGVRAGDTVVIFGAGPIGLLAAQWARIHGAAAVWLADIDATKFACANALGFSHVCNPREQDVRAVVMEATRHGADAVIEATGAARAFEQAVQCARPFGSVALLGNPEGAMSLSQQAYWHVLRNELRLQGCWNSVFAHHYKSEWTLTLECMASGQLQTAPLVSHRCTLDTLADQLRQMRDKTLSYSKTLLVPDSQ